MRQGRQGQLKGKTLVEPKKVLTLACCALGKVTKKHVNHGAEAFPGTFKPNGTRAVVVVSMTG